MSKKIKSKKPETYHHGDLCNVLVEEALKILKEKGTQGFTFRELSKRAGVSPTAHYRHFPTKEDLFAKIAIDGFGILKKYLESAIESFPLDPKQQLLKANLNYFEMVSKYPQHMYIMFGDTLAEIREKNEVVKSAGNETYQTLLRLIQNCQIAKVLDPKADSNSLAIQVLSIVHGFSTLSLQGIFKDFDYSRPSINKFIEEFTMKQIKGFE